MTGRRLAGLAAALVLRALHALASPDSLLWTLLVAAEAVAWILTFELGRGPLDRRVERRLEGWGLLLAFLSPLVYLMAFAGVRVPVVPSSAILALAVALMVGVVLVAGLSVLVARLRAVAFAVPLATLAVELVRGGSTTLLGWVVVVAAVAALLPRDRFAWATGDPSSPRPSATTGEPRSASLLVPVALALPMVHMVIGWWGAAGAETRLARDAVVGVHVVIVVALAVARYLVRETLLRRSERRLRESEDRYRMLVEASPDAVLLVQGEQVVFANPAARRLFALADPAEGGAVKTRGELGLPPLAATDELPVEHCVTTAEGERVLELSCRAVPYRDEQAWQVVARDVTPLRRLRDEAERMERLAALGELGASIAHEIRNPLGSLLFNVRYLTRARVADPAVAAEVAAIDRDVDRIQEVIAGVLALARSDDLDQTGSFLAVSARQTPDRPPDGGAV